MKNLNSFQSQLTLLATSLLLLAPAAFASHAKRGDEGYRCTLSHSIIMDSGDGMRAREARLVEKVSKMSSVEAYIEEPDFSRYARRDLPQTLTFVQPFSVESATCYYEPFARFPHNLPIEPTVCCAKIQQE